MVRRMGTLAASDGAEIEHCRRGQRQYWKARCSGVEIRTKGKGQCMIPASGI